MDALPTSTGSGPADELPHQLKLLCLSPRRPEFAPLVLQLDAADRGAPCLHWCGTAAEAMARLRNETFHCIVIADSRTPESPSNALFADLLAGMAGPNGAPRGEAAGPSDDPSAPAESAGGFEALNGGEGGRDVAGSSTAMAYDFFDVVDAIRSAGCRDPIVLLAPRLSERDWERVAESDAEVLVSPAMWSSAALGPTIRRALNRQRLRAEVDRLETLQRQRIDRERREAEQILAHQAALLGTLQSPGGAVLDDDTGAGIAPPHSERPPGGGHCDSIERHVRQAIGRVALPEPLRRYYRELLRSYVIMGSGNMTGEVAQLATLLRGAGIGPAQAFAVHVATVFELIRGLGQRSTRHVITRADLLAIELLLQMSRTVTAAQTTEPEQTSASGGVAAQGSEMRPAA